MGRSAPRGSDYAEVIAAAHRLHSLGARRGAFAILFNAAVQRQAADRRDLAQWTPDGPIPLRGKPEPHPAPANDHPSTSQAAPVGTGL